MEIFHELKMRPNVSMGYLFMGELYLNVGEKEKSIENLKKAEGMFQKMGMDYWLGRTRDVLAAV